MFSEIYNNIVDKKFRDNVRRTIISTFNITYATFQRWANGVTIPKKRYRAVIAEILGEEISTLFPEDADKAVEENSKHADAK